MAACLGGCFHGTAERPGTLAFADRELMTPLADLDVALLAGLVAGRSLADDTDRRICSTAAEFLRAACLAGFGTPTAADGDPAILAQRAAQEIHSSISALTRYLAHGEIWFRGSFSGLALYLIY